MRLAYVIFLASFLGLTTGCGKAKRTYEGTLAFTQSGVQGGFDQGYSQQMFRHVSVKVEFEDPCEGRDESQCASYLYNGEIKGKDGVKGSVSLDRRGTALVDPYSNPNQGNNPYYGNPDYGNPGYNQNPYDPYSGYNGYGFNDGNIRVNLDSSAIAKLGVNCGSQFVGFGNFSETEFSGTLRPVISPEDDSKSHCSSAQLSISTSRKN